MDGKDGDDPIHDRPANMMTRTPVAGDCHAIAPGVLRLTAPNPGLMTGPGTNTWLIGETDAVVIDPGVADDAHLAAIVTHAPGPIREILITHKHPDHTGGAAELSAMTGAPVRAGATPLAAVQDPEFVPDAAIAHGEIIDCGNQSIEAVYTPGHTPDHLCFLLREHGLLFAGDAVMADVTVVIAPPDGDMRAYFETLEMLQTLPITAIAPAHGRVLEAPAAEIESIIKHRTEREAQVRDLLAEGAMTPAQLAARIYPGLPAALTQMARAQVSAHLIKLEGDGCVHRAGEERWVLNA